MSLQSQIKEHMKDAMKAKDTVRLTAIRGTLSAMTNKAIELGKSPQDELSDEEALAVITTEVKRRKDACEQFLASGREDLAEGERAEIEALQIYLPVLMSREEIKTIVQAKKEELGITDKSQMGQFIGTLMQELKGKADGAEVKAVVEEVLAQEA